MILVGLGVDVLIFDGYYYFNEWTLMGLGVLIFCGSAIFWVLWNDRLSRASTWILDEGDIVIIRSLDAGTGRKVAHYIAEKLLETRGEATDLALAMASKSETPLKTYNFVSALEVSQELVRLEGQRNVEVKFWHETLLVCGTGFGCMFAELLMHGIEGRLLYAFLFGLACRLGVLLAVPLRKNLEPVAQEEIDAILSRLRVDELRELMHFGFVGKSAVKFLLKAKKESLF